MAYLGIFAHIRQEAIGKQMNMNRFDIEKLSRFALFCAVALVCIFSIIPAADVPSTGVDDKLNHFLAYGVLTGLASLAWINARLRFALIGTILLGLVLETFQGLMPLGRSASFFDMLANIGGAIIGAACGAGMRLLFRKRIDA